MPDPTRFAPQVSSPTASPIAVVVGHICLDIIPAIDSLARQGGQLVLPGKRTDIGPAALATGGVVSNTGLALHRLGIQTRLLGKIGDDLFGRTILDILHQRDPGLTAGMIVDPTSPTSYTIVISAPGFDRGFLHCAGANDTFHAADVTDEHLAGATLFHFGYPPTMRRIYADGGQELANLMQRAKQAGAATSLDTSHVDADAPAGRVDWRSYLQHVLPHVDFFLPSLDEICYMLEPGRFATMRAESEAVHTGAENLAVQGGVSLLRDLASQLLQMGAALVALKLGDQGIYLRTTSDPTRLSQMGKMRLSTEWLDRELLAPAFQVEVVGTTGAGDCAVAGLLGAMLRGLNPEAALTAAVGAGASNVEVVDATSGVPTWEELHSRIERGWSRRPLRISLPDWQMDATTGLWHSVTDRPWAT
ncbi:MAG: carbohydrate kinase family protein [Caldilineaceae bacterium]|nr:carbohydrate kinase family protein [Caldilineaceae bacterium]